LFALQGLQDSQNLVVFTQNGNHRATEIKHMLTTSAGPETISCYEI